MFNVCIYVYIRDYGAEFHYSNAEYGADFHKAVERETHIYVYIYMYVHSEIYISVYIFLYMHVCMCLYVYTYAYVYMYIYMIFEKKSRRMQHTELTRTRQQKERFVLFLVRAGVKREAFQLRAHKQTHTRTLK